MAHNDSNNTAARRQSDTQLRRRNRKVPDAGRIGESVDANASSYREKRTALPIRAHRRSGQVGSQERMAPKMWKALVFKLSNWKQAIADPVAYLPLLIAFAGAAYVFAIPLSPGMAAIATFTTAALCLIAMQILPLLGKEVRAVSSIEDRFEQLEDMAWELRESEERYRILAETFGDLLVLRDGNGKITYCNQAYCNLLDTDKSEVLDRQILLPEVAEALQTPSKKPAQPTGQGRELTVATSKGDRQFHWLDLPVRDERSGKTGTLSLARDITVFKNIADAEAGARQKAEQATRAKSRFLAMVSHEMRTPLNGILGMSKLLGDTQLDREQANYVNALAESGKSLLGLINDMLDMTMIEAGRFSLNKREFSPAALVRETGEVLSQKAYEKKIEFAIYTDPECDRDMVSDPERFRQVVTNLIGNAIKFTKSGGISVNCRSKRGKGNKKAQLVVEVSDTGPGMSRADAKRIFSEFERLDNEATREVDGAGLGLAIARALAVQLGGSLELAATGKNGSTFRFTMPFKEGVQDMAPKKDGIESDGLEIPVGYKAHTLIVSRNTMEAASLSAMLANIGMTSDVLHTEASITKALKRDRENKVHVLFDPEGWEDPGKILPRLKSKIGNPGIFAKIVKPGEAGALKSAGKSSLDTWLVRPVRPVSLKTVLASGNLEAVDAPELSTPDKPETAPAGDASILLVEDNEINALLVVAALKRHGIAVDRACDGREAVEKFKLRQKDKSCGKYKLVLMDMQMPVMNGADAIKAIRVAESAGSKSPGRHRAAIHVLSADEQEASRNMASSAGADGFIVKPVDPATLVDLANTVLESAKVK